jgi:hypothetical protein
MHAILETLHGGPPGANPAMTPAYIRITEAAGMLGISPELLLSAIDAGQLPIRCTPLGARGIWHCAAADVAAHLRALRVAEG